MNSSIKLHDVRALNEVHVLTRYKKKSSSPDTNRLTAKGKTLMNNITQFNLIYTLLEKQFMAKQFQENNNHMV